jgi:hypothetical protein
LGDESAAMARAGKPNVDTADRQQIHNASFKYREKIKHNSHINYNH